MGKRLIVEEASPCPFCGAKKIFLKAYTEGGCGEKRFAVSLQCSKCHVNGPQVFSEWKYVGTKGIGYFEDLIDDVKAALIASALEKWNTRFTE